MIETIALGAGAVAAASAAAVSLRKLGGQINEAMRRQHQIDQLLQSELTINGGTSMKDQLWRLENRLADAKQDVEEAKQQVGQVQYTLDSHLSEFRQHLDDECCHRDDDGEDG